MNKPFKERKKYDKLSLIIVIASLSIIFILIIGIHITGFLPTFIKFLILAS